MGVLQSLSRATACCVVLLSACGGGGNDVTSGGGVPNLPGVPVPASGAYFGAWVNPSGTTGPTPEEIEAYTAALELQIGRKLALHMHYYPWHQDTSNTHPQFPDAAMQSDMSAGRTPVVTWACGDANGNVANGLDDALLVNTASAVKQFGQPIFIRWYWEMNLAPGTNNQDCMGSQGAAGYIAAWRHIHDIFMAQGVTNVSWLWNPAGAKADADPAPYYPGDAYVDWIGFDGYDKVAANDFGQVFGAFYAEFSPHAKPMLIAETGECPGQQAAYLGSAQAEIEAAGNATSDAFPMVKGFMYFDAPGQFAGCEWNFGSAGTTAFATMGADPYFQATP